MMMSNTYIDIFLIRDVEAEEGILVPGLPILLALAPSGHLAFPFALISNAKNIYKKTEND